MPLFDRTPADTRIAHDLIDLAGVILDQQGQDAELADYGAEFDNDVFSMRQYCWCESENCPVCAICTCPEGAYTYLIDGKPADFDTWMRGTGNGKRTFCGNNTLMCDWCAGRRKREPLFLHKPSGSTVSWYKYIGRSMDVDLEADWSSIVAECRASLEGAA